MTTPDDFREHAKERLQCADDETKADGERLAALRLEVACALSRLAHIGIGPVYAERPIKLVG